MANNVNILSYAATNVTTSAYVTLVVATPYAISQIQIVDTSGQLLKIAKGLPGQEVDIFGTPLGGSIVIPYYLQKGERISIKAVTGTASTGYNMISFLKNNTSTD